MTTALENTALRSLETLTEAARQIVDAYPGPYARQRAGVAFLSRQRAILVEDMGLGQRRPGQP